MILTICKTTNGSIRRVCKVLDLPKSSYYSAAKETVRQASDREVGDLIEEVFHAHKRRYGYRRIGAELRDRGAACSPSRIRRLMKSRRLFAIQPRRHTPRTSDGAAPVPASNLLQGKPLPIAPNRVWTGDITYIKIASGWAYLAVVIDLYSRRIIGWSIAEHMRTSLVTDALNKAIALRKPAEGVIFHSDRGSQYGSAEFRTMLKRAGLKQSMSAKANPYDNAWTESFMGTLKSEQVRAKRYQNLQEARQDLFEYIDGYYNTIRKHSAIDYFSPNQRERRSLN